MELATLRRRDGASSRQEDGFGVQPRRVADLGMVPNLRQSNSSLCRSRRSQYPFGNCEKQGNLSSWIPENIKKKECVYFVESSKLSDAGKVVCECGYTREQHLEEATRPHAFQGKEWDPKKHVQEMPTDAFGDIVFTGLGQKYVRLSQDTPSSLIYHLMTQHWGLDAPNLLISVTGGAKDFNMKPRLKSVFRRGLVKVAQTTGAWIITGGSHTGVMKQVGEAGGFPAEYIMDEDGQGHLTCLDSNHSHFVLVDDGTHGRYGVEIPLRTKLEKFISEQTKERGGVRAGEESGPGLTTIYNAITNGTPCVIVEGSGRVADVIAQVASLPISEITISLIQQKLGLFFQEMFETFTESRIVEWTKKIQDIVRRRQLLTVFREGKDGQQDVDVAILQALLKELYPMMTAALIANKPEFVKLFLENGVRLKEFVTWDTLLYLYENLEPTCLFHYKLHKVLAEEPERPAPRVQMHHVAQVLRELLGDSTQPLYPRPRSSDRPRLLLPVPNIKLNVSAGCVPRALLRPRSVQGVSLRSLYKRSSGHVAFTVDPVRDLLIWAIVQNRRELAEIIWAQSQDCIAAALACSKILKELSKEEEDTDSLEEMLVLADEYEQRAIGVFTECYRKDEERAQKLLVRVSEAWGKTTCLQLALEAKDMKFVSHGGIQVTFQKHLPRCCRGRRGLPLTQTAQEVPVWEPPAGPQEVPGTGLGRPPPLPGASRGIRGGGRASSWSTECRMPWRFLGDMARVAHSGCPSEPWRFLGAQPPAVTTSTALSCAGRAGSQGRGGEGVLSTAPHPQRELRGASCAPVVVFHLNILSYFAFLCLFAYVLMVDFQPRPSGCEGITPWAHCVPCQLFYDPDECGLMKMALRYFSDFWNKLDICAILLFIAGLTCRLVPSLLYPGRVILSLDFILFCLRLMHIFTISKTLGPKIIIVKRMMKDVFFFLFLLAVWVVSFGDPCASTWLSWFTCPLTPDAGVNFNLDHCSPNGTDPYKPKCPEIDATRREPAFPEWLTVILLCLYLLFTNILLLNLLIAMFNYTFQQVQERTDQIWKFQRHDLIEEYQGRPPAPPPFILLNHLHLFIKRVILKVPTKRHKQLKNKLEKNEEAALLSWEIYLKENYLQDQQIQQKQRPEQKIQDVSDKVDTMVDLLEMAHLKQSGSMEQRLASLEEQVAQTSRALHWIVKALRDSGFGSEEGVPTLAPQKASVGRDPELDGGLKVEDPGDAYHVDARHLLYPNCPVQRFPVPNEKVPWENKDLVDPVGDALEPLSRISYNAVDGRLDRRSFHGVYAVQDGLPLNPMGRTGLRGRGDLSCFGPNHTLQPVVTRWRRNQDGAICRKGIKKMLEVLVVKRSLSEHWVLPGGSREPGETLPRKLKQVLRREFWPSFESLLTHGMEHLHSCDAGVSIRWQVVDERIPLYANHKAILQKVAALFGAYY
ncbi:hypothetical protein E2I00_019756 [Balaenoptera physalus]|uniref:Transient receptor potential cation channel subfamily M member 2 n=1 Tax=Balaenoptera physalus TaxID=9770 RepID=A0A643CDR2_BALPH|nr:hypothetical protein E2I00_019756 [Balaenoptera physalus]